MSGEQLVSRQAIAQSAVVPGVNVVVTGVAANGKTIARVQQQEAQRPGGNVQHGSVPAPVKQLG